MSDARLTLRQTLAEVERDYILKVLKEEGGSRKRAAAVLGVSTRFLYYFLAGVRERSSPEIIAQIPKGEKGGFDRWRKRARGRV